jgi:ketosteroid isomerase-like protein
MATQSIENVTARNVAIARAAYEAYVTKDRAALERLIADDFHFTSPLDNRLDRETYFRRCWPNSKVIEGFDFVNLVTDADRVFVTYEGRNTNGRRFRNTEILTIRDQHIIDVEVYFGWSLPHQAPQGGFVNEAASSFAQVLHANGPDTERAHGLELYSWIVGRWELDVTTILEDGTTHRGRGEMHAGWVLQGRAIQDVWMIPRLRDRQPGIEPLPGAGNWYGTTLRTYDPALDAWRIQWSDPVTGFFTQQIGRAQGSDIVQTGPDPRGGSMRWVFSEIQPDSFHWTGERAPDERSWRREVDIRARRG